MFDAIFCFIFDFVETLHAAAAASRLEKCPKICANAFVSGDDDGGGGGGIM